MRRLVPLLLVALLAGGCWDRTEVNDLALVTAMAIDVGDELPYRLSLQIILPQQVGGRGPGGGTGGGPGQEQSVAIFSREGRSLSEAANSLQRELSRRIRYGHTSFIVLGEEVARRGIADVIGFLAIHRDVRLRTQVYVTEGEGLEILKAQPLLESTPGAVVEEMGTMQDLPQASIASLADELSRDGIEPVITRLSTTPALSPSGAQGGGGGGGGQGGGGGSGQGGTRTELRLTGAGLFKRDRLVGFVGPDEAMAIAWVRNRTRETLFTVFPPEGGLVTLVGQVVRSRLEVVPGSQGPQARLELSVVGEFLENSARLDLTDPVVVDRLERLFEETVAFEVTQAIQNVQRRGTDVLGFGFALFKKDPQAWQDRWAREWDETFPTVPVQVKATVDARRIGLIPGPVNVPEVPANRFLAGEEGQIPPTPDQVPPGGEPPVE